MAKNSDEELMHLDFYEILGLQLDSSEKEIKKRYRKKALSCHPDRNPDNPEAAQQFIRLKKILEILIDPGARAAYDRVLKGRRAAAIRARESNAKSRKLKDDLERREQEAQLVTRVESSTISEEERLRRELKRLEEEGEKLIAEELEKVNKEVELELRNKGKCETTTGEHPRPFRVKARWKSKEDNHGYTKDEIYQLFFKWGEINEVVVKQRETRGTALIDYKEESGANMAVQFEKGMVDRPMEVSHAGKPNLEKEPKSDPKVKTKDKLVSERDYESVAVMNQRRSLERQKLIDEMKKNEDVL